MRASPSPETWMSESPPALSPVPLTSMGTLSTPPASEGSSAEKNQARSVPPALSTMAPSTIRSVAVGSSAPVHAVFQSASAPEAAFPVAASAPAAAGCSCSWGTILRAFLRGDGAARRARAERHGERACRDGGHDP